MGWNRWSVEIFLSRALNSLFGMYGDRITRHLTPATHSGLARPCGTLGTAQIDLVGEFGLTLPRRQTARVWFGLAVGPTANK